MPTSVAATTVKAATTVESTTTESSRASAGRSTTEFTTTESSRAAAAARSATESTATEAPGASIRRSAMESTAAEAAVATTGRYATESTAIESSVAATRLCSAEAAATWCSASEAAATVGVATTPPTQAALAPEISKALASKAAPAPEIIEIVKTAPESRSKAPAEPRTNTNKNAFIEIIWAPITIGCTCIWVVRVVAINTVRRWSISLIVWVVVWVRSVCVVAAVRPHSDPESESNLRPRTGYAERQKPYCTDANDEQVLEILHLALLTPHLSHGQASCQSLSLAF